MSHAKNLCVRISISNRIYLKVKHSSTDENQINFTKIFDYKRKFRIFVYIFQVWKKILNH